MLFVGDRNRGLGRYVIERIYKDLNGFNNYLTKVNWISFTINTFATQGLIY